jgi:transposase-like protein
VPRDRQASFEPQTVPKGETRFAGFADKILSMYARGLTTRQIKGHLEEIYGVEVSPTLISNVTDSVLEEVRAWQGRPLDPRYPIVYLDALVVKMRDNGQVHNRAVYVAIGITMEGHKEVLGLWTSANEGAKFWLQVLTRRAARRGSASKGRIGTDRVEEPRPRGHFHRLCGWIERISAGDGSGVSTDHGAAVHRAPDARQFELCQREGAQTSGG